jgi:hypothetical protein
MTGAHAANSIHKRRRLWLAAIGALLLVGGSAAAYYLSHGAGTGTSHGVDGAATTIPVTVTDEGSIGGLGSTQTPAGLVPTTSFDAGGDTSGASGQTVVFSLTAPSSANVDTITVAPKVDGSGNIYNQATGSPAVGCLGSWFNLSTDAGVVGVSGSPGNFHTSGNVLGLPIPITSIPSYSGEPVFLQDNGSDQSACENVEPEFTMTAS